jgi:hypothetical protein
MLALVYSIYHLNYYGMKVTSISFQKTIPTGPYMNEKLGVDIELSEGEHPEEAFTHAKELIDKWHKDNNPHLYADKPESPFGNSYSSAPFIPPLPEVQVEKPIQDRTQALIADINSCKEIKVLESYKLIARSNPDLKAAYDLKYESLQNQPA